MTEHNNPLMRGNPGDPPRGGKITVEQIYAHVDWLNSLNWVKASGKPYFVNTRDEAGRTVHFWDRSA